MKPITERLTMLENDMYVAPKDWMKRIRAEIQHQPSGTFYERLAEHH